jgi:hypothetical protein
MDYVVDGLSMLAELVVVMNSTKLQKLMAVVEGIPELFLQCPHLPNKSS